MNDKYKLVFRRRRGRFTFHFREDCPRFPLENFVYDKINSYMESQMICDLCNKKQQEDNLDLS